MLPLIAAAIYADTPIFFAAAHYFSAASPPPFSLLSLRFCRHYYAYA